MGKIWAVCSGSGGVGKSTVALSLAVGAAKAGKQTILLDASGIARSCDLVLKMENLIALDMMNVLHDQAAIASAVYPVPQYENLRFACASLYDHVPASELSGIMLILHSMCDILVIDLPTGEYDLGRGILRRGDERIAVTRPDDMSIRSVEYLLMRGAGDDVSTSIVINRISKDRVKRGTQYARETVENLLGCMAIGCIPEDASIPAGEKVGKPAIECDGPAWNALHSLTEALLSSLE